MPTPPRQRGRLVVALIVLILLLGAGAAAWAAFSRSPTPPAAAPPPSPDQASAETSNQPTATASTTTASTTTPSAIADPEDAALAQLTQQIALDRPEVQSQLAEKWVAQLSSKRLGLVVKGVSYTYPDILNDHLALRATYNARLVWSGDWSTFRDKNFYVTVAAVPFNTSAEANTWCDEQGLDADNCFAKRLSTTAGPAGNTVTR